MSFFRIGGNPPVWRSGKKTRQKKRIRSPGKKAVNVGILKRHVKRAILAPIWILVMRDRTEHAEQFNSSERQIPHVLFLKLPLPEHNRRHWFSIVVQSRRSIEVGDTPTALHVRFSVRNAAKGNHCRKKANRKTASKIFKNRHDDLYLSH